MKKIVIAALLCILCTVAYGQTTVKQNGKNFTEVATKSSSTPGKDTGFTFTTKDGQTYPILMTKSGRCYVNRISKKTGKEYKYYVPDEVCIACGGKPSTKNKSNETKQ
jgi:hypothetical protein